jgi:hypothetical protein
MKPSDIGKANILPNSRMRESKNVISRAGVPWVPIFCANCGADGGWVPEQGSDFAFYLCNSCAEKWAPLSGMMVIPDEVFWEKVKQEQIERHGRELTAVEIVEALKDEHHPLTKLARERDKYK